MSTYSVAQVQTLTGINAHTLRVWERRYSFLKPERTSTNIRYYNDKQLRKLLNISLLTRNGYRISRIDKMTEEEIGAAVTAIVKNDSSGSETIVNRLTLTMLDLDESAFESVFDSAVSRWGIVRTIKNVIYPFLHHVGLLWGTNRLIPAQEHFASNLIRQKLIAAIDALPCTHHPTARIILFLPEGESHEIGLLLAYYLAKKSNWKVYYLGQNVPTENLIATQKLTDSSYFMTMLTTPRSDDILDTLKSVAEKTGTKLLISGGISPDDIPDHEHVVYLSTPDDFIDILTAKDLK